jgi:hypothetical protein
MRFIELHDSENNPVLIAVNQILWIKRSDNYLTGIAMYDGVEYVTETPDEILLKIRG